MGSIRTATVLMKQTVMAMDCSVLSGGTDCDDVDPEETADTDGDGTCDNDDVFPEDASEQLDSDETVLETMRMPTRRCQ